MQPAANRVAVFGKVIRVKRLKRLVFFCHFSIDVYLKMEFDSSVIVSIIIPLLLIAGDPS